MQWSPEKAFADFRTVASLAGVDLSDDDLEIRKLQAPHRPPTALPPGRIAVYVFSYGPSCLKVGQAGARSQPRYTSQHYNPRSAMSTLAKSILADKARYGLMDEIESGIGAWIRAHGVPDRELAVAVAHHLLDKHAHEAIGGTSLEIHLTPPEQLPSDKERSDSRQYEVSPEARKQAQTLGIRGDIEARVARMACHAAAFTHPMANRRFGRFIMRIEHRTVVWIGVADTPRGPRKAN
jgi:hypothetical protein